MCEEIEQDFEIYEALEGELEVLRGTFNIPQL